MACHSLRPDRFVPGVSGDGKPAPLDASAAAYVGDGGLCARAAALSQWLRRMLAASGAQAARLARPNPLADGTHVPCGFGLSTREFLGRRILWHGGNVDSHSTLLACLPDEDIGLVILAARGFVRLTELMPALIGAAPRGRVSTSRRSCRRRSASGCRRMDRAIASSWIGVKSARMRGA